MGNWDGLTRWSLVTKQEKFAVFRSLRTTRPSGSISKTMLETRKSWFSVITLASVLAFIFLLHLSPFTKIPANPPFTATRNFNQKPQTSLKVFVAPLPRSLNYGLLDQYWSSNSPDSRIVSDPDHPQARNTSNPHYYDRTQFPPYPTNALIQQYSAEYWLTGDLMTPEILRAGSFAKRVHDPSEADVVFVPFFAALSAEMELARGKGTFKRKEANEDYARQKKVLEIVKNSEAWKRSRGRDHVFVITDPVAMWHARADIASSILLVVDFGGWHRADSKSAPAGSCHGVIQHTAVSPLKDVIVPYTHLIPRLDLSENEKRDTLLYFKGAKHRHRGGVVREKLWDLLIKEPGVVMEEGFPDIAGKRQTLTGMRSSEFCLNPSGDTPTSCRLFDSIQSLCIPVIVSDDTELPFEGMIDYSEFSVFVAVGDALRPGWLLGFLRGISQERRDGYRRKLAEVQPFFEFENGHPGGIGPVPPNGAVNHIWRKVHQKVPAVKEAIARERRKPLGVPSPMRCHCI